MASLLNSLVKKIRLSSRNQLLKCVLLNTAVELFSYVDAASYSSSGHLYYEWSMEDFDHTYCGKNVEIADALHPPLSSDRIAEADLCQDPSVVENVSEDELETMNLPILDDLGVQDCKVNDQLDSEHFKDPEPFCYLACPISLWLELPWIFYIQSSPPFQAVDSHFIEETFLSFVKVSSGLSYTMREREVNCGVQTAEEPLTTSKEKTLDNSQMESFSTSFSHGSAHLDVMESIPWDSYDLHLSRIPEYVDPHEEELERLAWQGVENLCSDLISVFNVTGEAHPQKNTRLEKQHISSTPSVEKIRSMWQGKDFLQHGLINERTG
ncbi:uncharacterized protein [Dendrobates tinctorius]